MLSRGKNLNFKIFIFPKIKSPNLRVYEIQTKKGLDNKKLVKLAEVLLADPVAETYHIQKACSVERIADRIKKERLLLHAPRSTLHAIIWLKEGVFDAEGDMALYAAKRLGLAEGIERIKFGRGHVINAEAGRDEDFLYNPLVETMENLK
ncbi:MAG: hypothetical protein HY747_09665 [Elusimicrobia bacterium]|nr:hypothetical protein [Elusimicrobiota bacterium]